LCYNADLGRPSYEHDSSVSREYVLMAISVM
jgi:hypothetical protein